MPARMNSRLIVVLNDNDMSIAPPVGALSAYLARRVSGRGYHRLRKIVQPDRQAHAEQDAASSARWRSRNTRAAWSPAARCSTSSASSMSARSTATTSITCCRCCKNVRDAKNGPFLVHVVTQKGKGYAPAEKSADKYHGVVKFDVATGAQEKSKPTAPAYQKVYRREPDQGSAQGRQDRRHHRGDAVGHRHRSVPEGISEPHLRRRHCRAARRDVRRRPCDRRLQAVRDHLFDLPAARLRPGRARRRDPAAAGALRHGPRRPGRRRRPDPCRLVRRRLSRLPARFRADGGGRRGRAGAHGGDGGRDRRSAVGAALSARRRPWRADAGRGQAARDRQGPHPARRHQGRAVLLRRAARRMPQGRRRARAPTDSRPPSPTRASPSRSTSTCCCGSPASTRCC